MGRPGIAEALHYFFIQDRREFAISDVAQVENGSSAAVRFTMKWLDAQDGARCTCFQSHHFEFMGGAKEYSSGGVSGDTLERGTIFSPDRVR